MNVLNEAEIGMVSGGEILVSPGQIGIALTDNSLVVITGVAEAEAAMGALGALGAAGAFGWAVGSALVDYTDIESWLGGWAYNMLHC